MTFLSIKLHWVHFTQLQINFGNCILFNQHTRARVKTFPFGQMRTRKNWLRVWLNEKLCLFVCVFCLCQFDLVLCKLLHHN